MRIKGADILEYWKLKRKSKFEKVVSNVNYMPYGIWYTEAFLFCSLCDMVGVDLILESGVANGISTEIFANYFDFNIIGVDKNGYGTFPSTKERLSKFKNVELIEGNSAKILPNIIRDNKDKKIGLFIDGPKKQGARDLRNFILDLECGEAIKCIGFHDFEEAMRLSNDSLTHNYGFLTHDLNFMDEFHYLNDKIFSTDINQKHYLPKGPGCYVEVRN